jgi:hypothetical protein
MFLAGIVLVVPSRRPGQAMVEHERGSVSAGRSAEGVPTEAAHCMGARCVRALVPWQLPAQEEGERGYSWPVADAIRRGGLRCRCYRAGEGGDTARYGRARSVPRPNTLHCGGAALGRLLRHMRSRLQYHSRYRWGSRGAGVLALAPLPRRSIAASPAGPTTTALPGVGPRGGDRRGLLVSPLSWRDEIRQLVRLGRIGAAGSTGIWPRMQVM